MNRLVRKSFAVLLPILSVFLSVYSAEAQLFGLLHPANPVRAQSLNGGGFLLIAGGADVGIVGQLRYGAGKNFDIGGKLGYLDEGGGGIMLGGDLMGQVVHAGKQSPFNLSLDGSFEVFLEDIVTIIGISGTGIIDDVVKLENGKTMRPYGGLALNIVSVDVDAPGLAGGGDTDLDITILGGIVYGISSQLDILGEIQISSVTDSGVGLNVGLNFR